MQEPRGWQPRAGNRLFPSPGSFPQVCHREAKHLLLAEAALHFIRVAQGSLPLRSPSGKP